MAVVEIKTSSADNAYTLSVCLEENKHSLYTFLNRVDPVKALKIEVFKREIGKEVWYCLDYIGYLNGKPLDGLYEKLLKMIPCLHNLRCVFRDDTSFKYEGGHVSNSSIQGIISLRSSLQSAEEGVKNEFRQHLKEQFDIDSLDTEQELPPDFTNQFWFTFFRSLSVQRNITTGHWSMYFFASDFTSRTDMERSLEVSWKRLVQGFFTHRLSNWAIGISLKYSVDGFALASYNKNFENYNEVFELEKALRLSNLARPLKYKLDCYTYCEINHGNKLQIRPTIFQSKCDRGQCMSTIDSDYTKNYFPEINFGDMVWRNNWNESDVMVDRFTTRSSSSRARASRWNRPSAAAAANFVESADPIPLSLRR